MAKISLQLKKNMRDNEAGIKEEAAKLEQFAGGPVTVDVDYAAFNAVLSKDSSYADRAGEAVKWLVEGLAYRWGYLFKDNEHFKDALKKAWKSKKLVIKADSYKRPSGGEYHKVSLENGDLVIGCDPESIVSNCSDIGTDSLGSLGLKTDDGMSIKLAANVTEYKPKIAEKEKEIAEATGVSGVALKVDYLKLDEWIRKQPDNGGSGYEDRSGEIAYWLIEALKDNLARLAKDDLVKEALQEGWKGEIHLTAPDPKLEDYHVSEIKDGKLILKYRGPATNVSYCGADIEKRL